VHSKESLHRIHTTQNHHRNLKTSKALLKSQEHQGTSLFTSAATNQRGVSKGGVKRSSGPISRIPGGDRVAVKVGVVQVEKVNDQMVDLYAERSLGEEHAWSRPGRSTIYQLFTMRQILGRKHRTQPENFHQLHRLQTAFECGE